MKKCNMCGIPESEWSKDMVCTCSHSHCDITPDLIIEQRIFDWYKRNCVLKSGMMNIATLKDQVEFLLSKGKSVPNYIIQFITALDEKISR